MSPKSSKTFKSAADTPQLVEGRQYHIALAPGEIAPYILMCGDAGRVKKVASFFDKAGEPRSYRNYCTVTGTYKGIPISIMGTAMGPGNTEIAVIEISQIVTNPTLIRIGSCGALQENIGIGDLVISSGAVRLESTSTYFVIEGYPSIAHHEVILSLLEAAKNVGAKFHVGITATAPGFYGAQARQTPYFTPRFKDLPDQLAKMNVANMEMEASTLFTLASVAGYRAGAVCAVFAQRNTNKFIDKETMANSEMNCIKTGLGAVLVLAKMDKVRGDAKHWLPSMKL